MDLHLFKTQIANSVGKYKKVTFKEIIGNDRSHRGTIQKTGSNGDFSLQTKHGTNIPLEQTAILVVQSLN